MVVIILIKKIISLALIMAMGYLLVKLKILKSEDSKGLSTLSMYMIMPCMIINAFQVDYTPEVQNGLLLAFAAAAAMIASSPLLPLRPTLITEGLAFEKSK